MNLYQELKKLTRAQCVEFAIAEAESVFHLNETEEQKRLARNYIDCAKAWIESPTQENKEKCRKAAAAAADYASYTAYTTCATDAAFAAANAATYAAYAANAARAKSEKESLDLIKKIKAQEQDA